MRRRSGSGAFVRKPSTDTNTARVPVFIGG